MYKSAIAFMVLFLSGCCCTTTYFPSYNDDCYAGRGKNCSQYRAPKGQVIHAAGFDIQQGQQMRRFFCRYEEPMHAQYIGNDTVRWVYYVDYNDGEGEIVRYSELEDYQPHSLCKLTVEFYRTYVSNAYTDC